MDTDVGQAARLFDRYNGITKTGGRDLRWVNYWASFTLYHDPLQTHRISETITKSTSIYRPIAVIKNRPVSSLCVDATPCGAWRGCSTDSQCILSRPVGTWTFSGWGGRHRGREHGKGRMFLRCRFGPGFGPRKPGDIVSHRIRHIASQNRTRD